jgi:hypothetical protein
MGVKNELFPLKCIWLLLHCLALPRWQVTYFHHSSPAGKELKLSLVKRMSVIILQNDVTRHVTGKIPTVAANLSPIGLRQAREKLETPRVCHQRTLDVSNSINFDTTKSL